MNDVPDSMDGLITDGPILAAVNILQWLKRCSILGFGPYLFDAFLMKRLYESPQRNFKTATWVAFHYPIRSIGWLGASPVVTDGRILEMVKFLQFF